MSAGAGAEDEDTALSLSRTVKKMEGSGDKRRFQHTVDPAPPSPTLSALIQDDDNESRDASFVTAAEQSPTIPPPAITLPTQPTTITATASTTITTAVATRASTALTSPRVVTNNAATVEKELRDLFHLYALEDGFKGPYLFSQAVKLLTRAGWVHAYTPQPVVGTAIDMYVPPWCPVTVKKGAEVHLGQGGFERLIESLDYFLNKNIMMFYLFYHGCTRRALQLMCIPGVDMGGGEGDGRYSKRARISTNQGTTISGNSEIAVFCAFLVGQGAEDLRKGMRGGRISSRNQPATVEQPVKNQRSSTTHTTTHTTHTTTTKTHQPAVVVEMPVPPSPFEEAQSFTSMDSDDLTPAERITKYFQLVGKKDNAPYLFQSVFAVLTEHFKWERYVDSTGSMDLFLPPWTKVAPARVSKYSNTKSKLDTTGLLLNVDYFNDTDTVLRYIHRHDASSRVEDNDLLYPPRGRRPKFVDELRAMREKSDADRADKRAVKKAEVDKYNKQVAATRSSTARSSSTARVMTVEEEEVDEQDDEQNDDDDNGNIDMSGHEEGHNYDHNQDDELSEIASSVGSVLDYTEHMRRIAQLFKDALDPAKPTLFPSLFAELVFIGWRELYSPDSVMQYIGPWVAFDRLKIVPLGSSRFLSANLLKAGLQLNIDYFIDGEMLMRYVYRHGATERMVDDGLVNPPRRLQPFLTELKQTEATGGSPHWPDPSPEPATDEMDLSDLMPHEGEAEARMAKTLAVLDSRPLRSNKRLQADDGDAKDVIHASKHPKALKGREGMHCSSAYENMIPPTRNRSQYNNSSSSAADNEVSGDVDESYVIDGDVQLKTSNRLRKGASPWKVVEEDDADTVNSYNPHTYEDIYEELQKANPSLGVIWDYLKLTKEWTQLRVNRKTMLISPVMPQYAYFRSMKSPDDLDLVHNRDYFYTGEDMINYVAWKFKVPRKDYTAPPPRAVIKRPVASVTATSSNAAASSAAPVAGRGRTKQAQVTKADTLSAAMLMTPPPRKSTRSSQHVTSAEEGEGHHDATLSPMSAQSAAPLTLRDTLLLARNQLRHETYHTTEAAVTIGREREHRELYGLIKGAIDAREGVFKYVCGQPGQGKTMVVDRVIQEIYQEYSKKYNSSNTDKSKKRRAASLTSTSSSSSVPAGKGEGEMTEPDPYSEHYRGDIPEVEGCYRLVKFNGTNTFDSKAMYDLIANQMGLLGKDIALSQSKTLVNKHLNPPTKTMRNKRPMVLLVVDELDQAPKEAVQELIELVRLINTNTNSSSSSSSSSNVNTDNSSLLIFIGIGNSLELGSTFRGTACIPLQDKLPFRPYGEVSV